MVARVYDQSGRMATSDAGYRQQCMPAPCSVVQADFREKIDSPDLDYNFADVQIWVRQHVAFLSLVAFFFFSPSIAVQVPVAPVQLVVLPDSAMVDLAQVAHHSFLLVTQLPREQGCASITVEDTGQKVDAYAFTDLRPSVPDIPIQNILTAHDNPYTGRITILGL